MGGAATCSAARSGGDALLLLLVLAASGASAHASDAIWISVDATRRGAWSSPFRGDLNHENIRWFAPDEAELYLSVSADAVVAAKGVDVEALLRKARLFVLDTIERPPHVRSSKEGETRAIFEAFIAEHALPVEWHVGEARVSRARDGEQVVAFAPVALPHFDLMKPGTYGLLATVWDPVFETRGWRGLQDVIGLESDRRQIVFGPPRDDVERLTMHHFEGESALDRGDVDAAIHHARAMLATHPATTHGHELLGRAYFLKGETVAAIAAWSHGLESIGADEHLLQPTICPTPEESRRCRRRRLSCWLAEGERCLEGLPAGAWDCTSCQF